MRGWFRLVVPRVGYLRIHSFKRASLSARKRGERRSRDWARIRTRISARARQTLSLSSALTPRQRRRQQVAAIARCPRPERCPTDPIRDP